MKCNRDRICGAVCPRHIIQFPDNESYPVARQDAVCFECGQCMAACPHDALTLKNVSPERLVPIKQELVVSPDQVQQFLTSRRSIRNFENKPVDRAMLQRIIDIAAYAPAAKNWQMVHWLVVEDPKEVKCLAGIIAECLRQMMSNFIEVARSMHSELGEMLTNSPEMARSMQEEFSEMVTAWDQGCDRILRGAPHVILAHANIKNIMARNACTIALTYLELAAYGLGLGACWAGLLGLAATFFPPMMQKLALPEGHQVVGAMMVGHPKYKYHRIPLRIPIQVTWR